MDQRLNSTCIGSPQYLEQSLVTPIFIPGVGNRPIRGSIFLTPTDDPHSMPSKMVTMGVLINTRFVSREVSIDRKCSSDRVSDFNFFHDGFLIKWNDIVVQPVKFIIIILLL